MKKFVLILIFFWVQVSIAQIVNIPDANFLAELISDGVDTNDDGQIQVSEAEAVTNLVIISSDISSLEGINSFTNLLTLNCGFNDLNSLDLSGLSNLTQLFCRGNPLTFLNVSHLTQLTELDSSKTDITSLNIPGLSNLISLVLKNNHFQTELDVTGLSNLEVLDISLGGFSVIGFEDLTNLVTLNMGMVNSLGSTLDISHMSKLKFLNCSVSIVTSIIFPTESSLESLEVTHNNIPHLDLSNQKKLKTLHYLGFDLETLNVKNGSVEELLNIPMNDNLRYICVDPEQFDEVQSLIEDFGYTNCVVTTYCSFDPGGDIYHVQGNVKVDIDQDGCDSDDLGFPFLQIKVADTDGGLGIYSSESDGSYNIALPEGDYTIDYQFPYMSYFDVSPSSFSVNFPTDTSPFVQDICITPSGNYNDLQIAIIPLEGARPGFDTSYKIVYANVGTSVLSGDVTFNFEDDVLDFVSASINPDTQNTGELSWSFSNLAPFDIKTLDVSMNLNAPTETPPLNDGDILCYEAIITPTNNDEIPNDNSFSLKQTVVNSFDPNDKTCLEGDVITPDLVGEYVHYLIRFENTGSASAVNIVVKDIIDTDKFDMESFVPVNASHDFVTRIQNDNEIEFIFEGINLPFDDANNDGFVLFKIKTLPSLVVGDTFENSAEIYFDFNFPIITNTEQTTIDTTASTDDFALNSNIIVYPNPAENQLRIESQIEFDSIVIYDLTGKEIKRIVSTENRLTQEIDVSNLKSGIYYISIQSGNSKKIQKFLKY